LLGEEGDARLLPKQYTLMVVYVPGEVIAKEERESTSRTSFSSSSWMTSSIAPVLSVAEEVILSSVEPLFAPPSFPSSLLSLSLSAFLRVSLPFLPPPLLRQRSRVTQDSVLATYVPPPVPRREGERVEPNLLLLPSFLPSSCIVHCSNAPSMPVDTVLPAFNSGSSTCLLKLSGKPC
jgi:hypothetical protein